MFRRWYRVLRVIVADVRRRAGRRDLTLIAAGLTLYACIALVPLLLFGLYGAGLLLGAERVADLVERLASYAPETLGVRASLRALGGVGPQLSIPTLLAALVTATTYGEGLLRAVDSLDGADRSRKSLRGRLRVLPYVGVFPLVTVGGLAAVAVLPGALGGGTGARLLGVYATFWVAWLSAAALLAVLYRLFAGHTLRWAAIVWSALATGSFLAGMSMGWLLLLRFGITVGRAFGGSEQVGGIVLFTLYLLLVQIVVLIGHLLAQAVDQHLRDRGGGDATA